MSNKRDRILDGDKQTIQTNPLTHQIGDRLVESSESEKNMEMNRSQAKLVEQ